MKSISIYFVDFWNGFNLEDNFFIHFLSEMYTVVLDKEKPDYIIYSCFGYRHFNYNESVKIFFSVENVFPDFNLCDYALGCQHFSFQDRYLRFPYFIFREWDSLESLESTHQLSSELFNRKFCNFVYSNGAFADPFRERFYKELSKYKKIDSGGQYLNNIGFIVSDKIEFIRKYKFTIAFENSSVDGYTTEKIIHPMQANSMPIYWGDPEILYDFNQTSFVNVMSYSSIQEAIEEIVYLDANKEAYMNKLSQSRLTNINMKSFYSESLKRFFENIFNQPLVDAIRITKYGYVMKYQRDQRRVAPMANNYLFGKICGLIEKI